MATLIVALDGDPALDLEIATHLARSGVTHFKVRPKTFYRPGGHRLVSTLRGIGARVFLDAKLRDTPDSVADDVAVICEHVRPWAVSINARSVADVTTTMHDVLLVRNVLLLAVASLTNSSPDVYWQEGYDHPGFDHADGAICHAQLARYYRHKNRDDYVVVCPGIRPHWHSGPDNHALPVSPGEAVRLGATHLVVGRPITTARDPVEAARRITDEMGAAS